MVGPFTHHETPLVLPRPAVLIVDDSPQMAETLAQYLSAHGFESITANDSDRAASIIAKTPIAALVTDLRMSGLDGLDLIETVRLHRPGIPVIVMTAFGSVETAVEAIQRGAFHYVTKPFRMASLRTLLEQALSAHPAGETRDASARPAAAAPAAGDGAPDPVAALVPLGMTLAELQDRYIAAVYDSVDGNRTRAAKILGLDPSTVYRRQRRARGRGDDSGRGDGD
jgi:DNA-binding NtrC family response regulator